MSTRRYRHELVHKIEQYRLDQRKVRWQDIKIAAQQNFLDDDVCEMLLFDMEPEIQHQIDYPDYLHRTPTEEQWYATGQPDVRLGCLLENSSISFGVRFDMPLHIIIAGLTGFGKTTLLRNLFKGIHEFNRQGIGSPRSVIALDRKGSDFGDIPDLFNALHYDIHNGLFISLAPPAGVGRRIWVNVIATILCARANLKAAWSTIVNALQWLLDALNPDPANCTIWPDLQLLLDVLNVGDDTLFSAKSEYSRSAKQPLEGLTLSSGNTFRAFQGFQIEDVVAQGKSAVISMDNMFPSWARQLCTDILLAQLLYGRVGRSHRVGSVEVLVLIDEADADISTEAEEMFPDRMCPISQCFKQGREFGISVCVSISSLRSASRFVLSNATNYYIFRMNDSHSVYEASRTLMLPSHGELRLTSLQQGECLVKQIGNWQHAVVGKVDYMPPCRTKASRNDSHPYVPAKRLAELPEILHKLKEKNKEHYRAGFEKTKAKAEVKGLSQTAHNFLMNAALHPFEPVSRLFDRLGGVSPATQGSTTRQIKDRHLAEFAQIRLGRSSLRLIDITEQGWRYLKKQPPTKKGRGGTVHQHFTAWISLAMAKREYKTILEWIVPDTHHPVDVCAEKEGKFYAFEVVVECFDNIIDHVKACFLHPGTIENLTIVTAQKSIAGKVEKLVSSDLFANRFGDRILYETIDTFLKEAFG